MHVAPRNADSAGDTSAPLPANLSHFAVLDQDRDRALAASRCLHSRESFRIRFDIVLLEIAIFPLQPFPQFAGIGATGRAVEFNFRHDRRSPEAGE